jgi:hypothetical protein
MMGQMQMESRSRHEGWLKNKRYLDMGVRCDPRKEQLRRPRSCQTVTTHLLDEHDPVEHDFATDRWTLFILRMYTVLPQKAVVLRRDGTGPMHTTAVYTKM